MCDVKTDYLKFGDESMYKIKETIIVEGVYDKIKLSGFIDGIILVTNGFTVFKDKRLIESIKTFAKETGIVILTDSDTAGFKIRNYIKQSVEEGIVLHAYVPDIHGKEKRKAAPGKEGLLGVEGIDNETILDALKKAGCTIDGDRQSKKSPQKITKAHMFSAGLSGGADSSEKRKKMATLLGIPAKISANMLLDVVNRLMDYDEFINFVNKLNDE